MTTIPASHIVSINPGVLNAGGNDLVLNGLILTTNTRVPVGTILPFASTLAVSNYFGATAAETTIAGIYFLDFINATQTPGNILFAQYTSTDVSAYLRGGVASGLTLAQLQAITGSLNVVVDGTTRTYASVNLSSATSFTSAATLLATGLNATPGTGASVTASIAVASPVVSVTGSISGNLLTVTAVTTGTIQPGGFITGTGIAANTQVTSQLSGTTGGIGTYAVNVAQVAASTTITQTYGTLTVTAVSSGTLSVGQTVTGGTTSAGTVITALGTGTGGTGTYIVNKSQTVTSGSLTTQTTPLAVTFDSVSGGFVITSGIVGAPSTIAFATGTAAAPLFLTAQTGAVLSQGAAATTPGAFMNSILAINQNWATFMLAQDPDNAGAPVGTIGSPGGNTQKVAFSNWVNTTNNQFCFVCWDVDTTPTTTVPASTSMGALITASNNSGTALIWGTDFTKAAFTCGSTAAINFGQTNGRITFAFKSQSGLVADVSSLTIANNLEANNYSYYGAFATANQSFIFLYPGSVSGIFKWLDSYINQIWLNASFQVQLMGLLTQVTSIPYNQAGYALIHAAMLGPINNALNFGAIRAGVTLSPAQQAEVNFAAGRTISDVLNQVGWYLQILDPGASVRAQRKSPIINFWYMDGEAVQTISLASIDVF